MASELQKSGYMMDIRALGIASLCALGLGACGLGSDDSVDDSALNKQLCHTDVNITGTMIPTAKPADYDPELGDTNCWAAGVWTFTAAPAAANEDGTAQCVTTSLLPEYKVIVVKDFANEGKESYAFATNPQATTRLKVSSGGGGLCEGVFEIYSSDGKVLHNLHPALLPAPTPGANHQLNGKGEYQVFEVDQRLPSS
jgi:hypothetical protein